MSNWKMRFGAPKALHEVTLKYDVSPNIQIVIKDKDVIARTRCRKTAIDEFKNRFCNVHFESLCRSLAHLSNNIHYDDFDVSFSVKRPDNIAFPCHLSDDEVREEIRLRKNKSA